jgi:predicted PurR-regulated permease PerM
LTLAIITAFYCFEGGPLLVRIVLDHSPLDPALRQTLLDRFRRTILGLLADSIGTAILRGAVMGLLAWIIAGFNPILIGIVATFISLLPVVGIAFVWIPLASLLWAQDAHLAAVCLGLASIASDWLVQRAGRRLSRAMSPRGLWMSFLLFLGLVGGLLAFGVKGFVFGPMTVVLTAFLLEVWLPLYGMGQPAHEQKPPPAPPPA